MDPLKKLIPQKSVRQLFLHQRTDTCAASFPVVAFFRAPVFSEVS